MTVLLRDNGHLKDKLAPHSVEAEEAVLGSILLNPDSYFDVAGIVEPAYFFIVRNGWVFEAIEALQREGLEIDYITVVEKLHAQGRLEDIGGPAYITYLINHTPSWIYAASYAQIVERAARRRRLLLHASECAQLAHAEDTHIDDVMARAEQSFLALTDRRDPGGLQSMQQVGSRAVDALMNGVRGIPTGFYDIDSLLNGLKPDDLILLAGRPSMGKTSLAMSITRNVAKAGHKVAFFTLEQGDVSLVQRWAAMEIGIDVSKQDSGKLTEQEQSALLGAIADIMTWPVFIDNTPGISPLRVKTECVKMKARHGLDLVVVDYLGLMSTGMDRDNRTAEVSYISRQLKGLARTLHVPVLALSQINRGVEGRTDKRPIMSDLRDSGELEQDADVIMLLYRDEYYNEGTTRPNQADVIVAKHRNGPTGVAKLYFRKDRTEFTNMQRDSIDLAGF